MKRREFIAGLAAAAAAWSVTARAQQPDRMRKVGVLMGAVANSAHGQACIAAFQQGLQQLGWTEGRNVRIDVRWPAAGNSNEIRRYAQELLALTPALVRAFECWAKTASFQGRLLFPARGIGGDGGGAILGRFAGGHHCHPRAYRASRNSASST